MLTKLEHFLLAQFPFKLLFFVPSCHTASELWERTGSQVFTPGHALMPIRSLSDEPGDDPVRSRSNHKSQEVCGVARRSAHVDQPVPRTAVNLNRSTLAARHDVDNAVCRVFFLHMLLGM